MRCLFCCNDSGRSAFCRLCREIKQNANAILVQNKKKLKILLESNRGENRLSKFTLYSQNIIHYGKVILKFKHIKEKKLLDENEDE